MSFFDIFYFFATHVFCLTQINCFSGYHVVGGPVSVQKPRYEAEIKKPLIESALQFGYDLVDVNARSQIGKLKI